MDVSGAGASVRIGLVTDSTAQLRAEEVARLGETTGGLFRVVPLTVLIAGESFTDGDLDVDELCRAMDEGAEVSTSMATPDSSPPPTQTSLTTAPRRSSS